MSFNYNQSNAGMDALRRLTERYDASGEQIVDFLDSEMRGEKPDQAEFMQMLETRGVTQDAMQAQFKLYEKPLKTVLNETR